MTLFTPGHQVRVCNPASTFHGRTGVIVMCKYPDQPNPGYLVRLLPDDHGPTLPLWADELEAILSAQEDSI